MQRHNTDTLLFGWAQLKAWVGRRRCRGPDTPFGEFVVLALNLIDAERCSGKVNWGTGGGGSEWEWLRGGGVDCLRRLARRPGEKDWARGKRWGETDLALSLQINRLCGSLRKTGVRCTRL